MASTVSALPLPDSEIIANDPELKRTWESANHWCLGFLRCEDEEEKKKELKRVDGHIQLACKTLSIRLKALIKEQADDSPAKAPALKILRFVHIGAKWIASIPVVQEFYCWGQTSSLQVAVAAAIPLYDSIVPEKADTTISFDELYAPMEHLVECKRVWENLALFCKTASDSSVIRMRDVKKRLVWLDEQIERQQSRDPVASPNALLASSKHTSTKVRKHLGEPPGPRAKRQRLGPASRSTHDSEDIMRALLFDPKLSPCLSWTDMAMIDTSSISDLTYPPAKPHASDLVALATGQELGDLIIDPYLALLCHHANGHFNAAQAETERTGSPKWYAWSTWFADQLQHGKSFKSLWTPKAYPGAKIGDVMFHVIPMHLDSNHWGMAILSNTDGTRRLDFYSSLEGYEKSLEKTWSEVASWLTNEAKSDLGLENLRFNVPNQPLQSNVVDCGVYICCELRWLIEGWPLHTLLSANMPTLRRRMVVELEKWSLSI